MRRAILTVAACAMEACAPSPASAPTDAASVLVNGSVLDVSGTMGSEMVRKMRSIRWTTIRSVRFTSAGGDPEAGLTIARLLMRNGLPIVIHDMCGSACLSVLVIRNHVQLAPGTLVLLHNSPYPQALTLSAYPRMAAALARLGAMDRDWLRRNGVDPRLLLYAEVATQPLCVRATSDSPEQLSQLLTDRVYAAWAPRDTTLTNAGIAAARGWRQNATTAIETMRTRFPLASLAKLRAGDEPDPLPDAATLKATLRRVPSCDQPAAIRPG